MRVLVCGGRDYKDYKRCYEVLNELLVKYKFSTLIHGDASGADRMACGWAVDKDLQVECYPAEWDKYGRSAGPIRNKQMLDEGKPDLVIAFPGRSGTEDMINQAKKAEVPCILINE